MDNQQVRVAVIGAGAIGGVTAAFLVRAGWNVEVVCKHQETLDKVITAGLHVSGVKGDYHVRTKAVKEIEDLDGPKDVVLLATKALDCKEAAARIVPYLCDGSALLSLQNGICEEILVDVVGSDRLVGCVVGWGATMHGPAELEVTSKGEFVIGRLDNKDDPRLPFLRDMLTAVVPTRISHNIMGELYSKLIVNACINSLGVIGGQNLGALLASRKARNIFVELMREAMAVADALNIHVEPGGGGKLDYYAYLSGNGFLQHLKRHLLIRVIGLKYRRIRSSSLQSLDRGLKTEVDFLNGYISVQGKTHGVATPLHDAVVTIVHDIEEGRRMPDPHNLTDPAFAGL